MMSATSISSAATIPLFGRTPTAHLGAAEPVSRAGLRLSDLFPVVSDIDLNALSDPQWQIDGLWEAGSLVLLYGEPGCGKSFLALDWACCIGMGLDWCDRAINVDGRVLYLYSEGRTASKLRVQSWKLEHGMTIEDSVNVDLLLTPVNLMDTGEGIERLLATVRNLPEPPVLIVVDTLARSFGGADENSASAMGLFIDRLGLVAQEFGATILLVHHSKKGGSGERGSSALYGAVDTKLKLTRSSGKPMLLTLECEKQKDGEAFDRIQLRLEPAKATGSCVIVPGNAGLPVLGTIPITPRQRECLASLAPFGSAGARHKAWNDAFGGRGSTFNDCLKHLRERGYVTQAGQHYQITPAGEEAIGLAAAATPSGGPE